MSTSSDELERLEAEFSKAAIQYPDLDYVLLESAEAGFPESVLQRQYCGKHFECIEQFEFGDHQVAHVILGASDAIQTLYELAARAIRHTPLKFHHSFVGESQRSLVTWIHAILSLDTAIGTNRFGTSRLWYEASRTDGKIEPAAIHLGNLKFGREQLQRTAFAGKSVGRTRTTREEAGKRSSDAEYIWDIWCFIECDWTTIDTAANAALFR